MTDRFPEYGENPKQKWVMKLDNRSREEYEAARQHDIDADVERITAAFRSVEDFEGVSDEAIGYMALRFAIPMRDCYEEGIQVGMDDERQRFEGERARHHSVEVNRLGGWG